MTIKSTCFAIGLLLASTQAALCHEYKLGDLLIDHPWTRATPNGAKVGGGYTIITNHGKTDDRLISATAETAGRVELHEMAVKDGVMSMRPLPEGVPIPAGSTVEFKPGGLHVMFLDLKEQLKEGGKVKTHLVFEKAGAIDVDFSIGAVGQTAPEHKHSH